MAPFDFIGIDFGAKNAGTTAICFAVNKTLKVVQSTKGHDADLFCHDWIHSLSPRQILIDAPLSLPHAYFGKGEDFLFRLCDRETAAMSPLFLGGLTARAMRLAAHFRPLGIIFTETYPKLVHQQLLPYLPKPSKKDEVSSIVLQLESAIGFDIQMEHISVHSLDAVLAWAAGWRLLKGQAIQKGDPAEGLITY